MATATELLAKKGYSILSVTPKTTVLQAVEKMNQVGCGAVVVMDEGRMMGMFTERDVLKRVIGELRDASHTEVGDVMTSEVVSCPPTAEIDDISTLMRNRRIRHIPICDSEGDLLGLVSIGDINAWNASNQEAVIQGMNDYICGRA